MLSKLCLFFIFLMHYIVFVPSLSRTIIYKHYTFVRCCLSFQAFKFIDELAVLHSSLHTDGTSSAFGLIKTLGSVENVYTTFFS